MDRTKVLSLNLFRPGATDNAEVRYKLNPPNNVYLSFIRTVPGSGHVTFGRFGVALSDLDDASSEYRWRSILSGLGIGPGHFETVRAFVLENIPRPGDPVPEAGRVVVDLPPGDAHAAYIHELAPHVTSAHDPAGVVRAGVSLLYNLRQAGPTPIMRWRWLGRLLVRFRLMAEVPSGSVLIWRGGPNGRVVPLEMDLSLPTPAQPT